MTSLFYPKFAVSGIRKNSLTYFPYILTCILTVMMFYIFASIAGNPGFEASPQARSVFSVLFFGIWIVGIFAAVFLFYTNSFLIKRRKKEFGLFNVLGMGKKHLSLVILWESLIIGGISIIIGLLCGVIVSRLMFLVLLKMINIDVGISFSLEWMPFVTTIILFSLIFGVNLLTNLGRIYFNNPLQLMKGARQGEKEPKTRWVLTIIGLLCLAGGYTISLTIINPKVGILSFLLAVILVIIGTYLLFIAVSVTICKLIKRNKKIYYTAKNFPVISGMIFRLKQNAVGLANICILSTMVLVTLITTVSLYTGVQAFVNNIQSRDVVIRGYGLTESQAKAEADALTDTLNKAAGTDVTISNKNLQAYIVYNSQNISDSSKDKGDTSNSQTSMFLLTPLTDFNRMENQDLTLGDDEVLVGYLKGGSYIPYSEPTITIKDRTFKVRQQVNLTSGLPGNMYQAVYLIGNDQTMEWAQSALGESPGQMNYLFSFDLDGGPTAVSNVIVTLEDSINYASGSGFNQLDNIHDYLDHYLGVYGSLLFLGVFVGILFLMATVLIIYYKQISEGFEDRERFKIMAQVGMSKKEIKHTISRQIRTIFFLPLTVAVVHVLFALPYMAGILTIRDFRTNNLTTAIVVSTITFIFALIYGIVYLLTSKTYYKIVTRGMSQRL